MPKVHHVAILIRFDCPHDARLANAQLEDADIPCMLSPPDATGLTSMFTAKHSGVQVKVTANRAGDARAVLGVADKTN